MASNLQQIQASIIISSWLQISDGKLLRVTEPLLQVKFREISTGSVHRPGNKVTIRQIKKVRHVPSPLDGGARCRVCDCWPLCPP